VSCTVSPNETRVPLAGVTSTVAASWATVIEAEAETAAAEAVTEAVPLPTAVTRPELLTVATPSSDDAQLNVVPSILFPLASCALAASCTVSPSELSDAVSGSTSTLAGVCATVIEAEPETPAVEAVTSAVPFPTAVTSPAELTAAQFSSDDDHVKETPVMALPLASRAVAVSWAVSPNETSVPDAGVTTTEARLGGCCVVSPAQAMKATATTKLRDTLRMDHQSFVLGEPTELSDLIEVRMNDCAT
jgi:predicted flap endonuclease-1-like 5' DNA nuclease